MARSNTLRFLLCLTIALALSYTCYGQNTSSSSISGSISSSGSVTASSSSATVVACRVRYCSQCVTGSGTICQTCYNGYMRNTAGLCVLTCRVNNCNECVTGVNTNCRVCRSPYTRLSNGLCGLVQKRPPTIIITTGALPPVSLLVSATITVLSALALLL